MVWKRRGWCGLTDDRIHIPARIADSGMLAVCLLGYWGGGRGLLPSIICMAW